MTQAIPESTRHRRLGLSLVAVLAVFAITVVGLGRLGAGSAQAQTGNSSITIVKQGLLGDDAATFTHDMSPGGSFQLTAADSSETFTDLAPGTYHVTEMPVDGYVLTGVGCSLNTSRSAPSLASPNGNTLGITLAAGQDMTCTFVNASTQVIQYTVAVSKVVDDVLPTEGSFDLTATWTAGNLNGGIQTSGNFTLDGGNGYAAVTSPMDAGADYSVVENNIDGTCDQGDLYRLVGYSVGATPEEAAVAMPGAAASFTNLQSNEYVVVHNETCAPVGTSSITIVKEGLIGDAEAVFTHDVPGQDSDTFTLTADANSITISDLPAGTYHFTEAPMEGWNLVSTGCAFTSPGLAPDAEGGNTLTVILGDDEDQTCTFVNEQDTNTVTVVKYLDGDLATAGSFDFSETNSDTTEPFTLDAGGSYQHESAALPFGTSYSLAEAGIDGTCDEGDVYRLAGYTVGASLEEALAAAPSDSVDIASLEADTFVIAWNQTCADLASITIVKDFQPDASADASFTVEGAGLEDFSIAEGAENGRTFDNLNAGDYSFTEDDLDGWRIQSIFCSGQSSPSNVLINLGGASATVTVNPGDHITCTFTNVDDGSTPPTGTGTITIIKAWDQDNGPDATFTTSPNVGAENNSFVLSDDGVGGDEIAFQDLPAASYTFIESALDGWTLTAINCTGIAPESIDVDLTAGSLGVNLAEDENVVCTFSNTMDEAAPTQNVNALSDVTFENVPVINGTTTNPVDSSVPSNTTSNSTTTTAPSVNVPSANQPSTNPSVSNPPAAVNPAPVNNNVSSTDSSAPNGNAVNGTEATSNVDGAAAAATPVAPSTGNASNTSTGHSPLLLVVIFAMMAGMAGVTVLGGARKR